MKMCDCLRAKSDANKICTDDALSRRETAMIQGVAAFLMVWHHLFGFPERIGYDYVLVLDSVAHIETLLSYFGRICIAMFAFCSGYGMQKNRLILTKPGDGNLRGNYRKVFSRLLKFYWRYWVVYLVFVPLGMLLGVYRWDTLRFVKGILGLNSVYNAEWWYVGYYIRIMLLLPLICWVGDYIAVKLSKTAHAGMLLVTVAVLLLKMIAGAEFLRNLLYFTEGMVIAQSRLIERICVRISNATSRFCTGLALLATAFLMRTVGVDDCFIVPELILGIVLLIKSLWLPTIAKRLLEILGKYATYIWLLHTFFAYYYFQKFVYCMKYSWLIAVWCIILCILCGMILEKSIDVLRKRTSIVCKG